MTTAAIDRFLALFLRKSARGEALPTWPTSWSQDAVFHDQVFDRIAFHGIALVFAHHPVTLAQWPAAVRQQLREEARMQSFWELGHKRVLARLIETLTMADTPSVITKGTALAYTLYPEPAMRRRGDSDLLLPGASRGSVRKVLAGIGMRQIGDARPLQESWAFECQMGFTHVFDLHWQSNASAVISQCFDRAGIGRRTIPLPQVSGTARAIAPTDNVILIAVNRALHGQFGYVTGADKAFEEDRLIWAMDFDLLTGAFSPEDWEALTDTAQASGTAPVVLSALDFTRSALGTVIPPEIMVRLAAQPGDVNLLRYIGALSGMDRLRLDLTACPTLTDKLRLVRYTLFPGAEVLHERFPQAAHWPIPALQVRRLLAGVRQLMQGRG